MQDISSNSAIRSYTRSSSFKMAALFTLLLGVSALILGYFLQDFGKQNFIRETHAAIDSEITSIIALSGGAPRQYVATIAAQRAHPFYLYMDISGQRLEGNIDQLPNAERITEGLLRFMLDMDGDMRTVAAKIHTFPNGERLLVARDIHDITASHERLEWLSGLIILFMLIVVLVSFFISSFVVSRINIIAATAKRIMETGDISARISIDTQWDDLSNLAQVLNDMLANLEASIHDIREVSDNIAHDLRTPLTRLRNRLEDLKHKQHSAEAIDALLGEADQLLNTFNSLLRIANIEKGQRVQQPAPCDLCQLLLDVIELYEPLAEEKQVRIRRHLAPSAMIQGDKDLLFQLFTNLLDNALKFAPSGTSIEVGLTSTSPISVTISDKGIGIAPEEREKVFTRFYRTDASRTTAGNGLGLSLVKAITQAHNAQITLEDNAPGLRVRVCF